MPPPANLDVRWTEIPFARSYVVQISADKDFADKREFAVAEPAAAVPVAKPGAYHVRVQALDEAGRPLTGFSPAENAAYDFLAPVAPPQLTEPGDRATIFLQTTVEPFIWLEWKKSERAGLYEVELSADPQFRTTLVSLRVAQNRFLIKTQIPTGKLYWRVRSLESETMVSDWAAARQLNILSRKNEGFE